MAKVEITPYFNNAAPLKAHGQTVMLKFTAPETMKKETAPLDIVFVLDTSGSMKGDKIAKMQKAMAQVLVKIGSMHDRVAIVPFSSQVKDSKYAKLGRVSEPAMPEMLKFVNGLKAEGNTNIRAGLLHAVELLTKRQGAEVGRAGVIFLMSDGAQNHGDAGKVDVSKVNVQTFGFGEKHDPKLLYALAYQSHGGAYHVVSEKDDANHLAEAFLHALGDFRNISVLNLTVTLKKQGPPEIHDVDPGTYKPKPVNGGSYTMDLGDLARGARRRIMLILRLPAVPKPEGAKTVMTVEWSYRIAGGRASKEDKHAYEVKMERAAAANAAVLKPQVTVELLRREHAASIGRASDLADKKDFGGATDILVQRLDGLDKLDVDHPKSDAVLDFLSTEMEDLLDKMGSQEKYDKMGKALTLSALSSHARQRPTARGKVLGESLFTTKRQDKYLAEARKGLLA